MNIKCLVISGGGPTGLLSYGAIKSTHIRKMWTLEELDSIYASSIGAFIACIIALGYDWDTMDKYLMERPWSNSFDSIQTDILEMFHQKGMDGESMFRLCMEPLLKAKDIPIEVTLEEFYHKTHIELVFTVTELNSTTGLVTELISYKTYPNMSLIQAIASTTAFPMLFKPIFYKEKCFMDGGLLHNLPINVCLEHSGFNLDEILVFGTIKTSRIQTIQDTTSFLDYFRILMNKCHKSLDTSTEQTVVPFTILSYADDIKDVTMWYEVLCNPVLRKELVQRGEHDANEFINSRTGLKTDLKC